MSEFVMGIWAGFMLYWLTWPVLAFSFFCCAWWLDDERWFFQTLVLIVFTLSVAAVVGFRPDLYTTIIIACLYPVVGVIWSLHRYKRYLIYLTEQYKTMPDSTYEKKNTRKKINNFVESTDKIVAWILLWPTSFLAWALRDIIEFVREAVTIWLKSLYSRIQEKYLIPETEKADD